MLALFKDHHILLVISYQKTHGYQYETIENANYMGSCF